MIQKLGAELAMPVSAITKAIQNVIYPDNRRKPDGCATSFMPDRTPKKL
jgi:hypothetical protein